MHHLRLAAAVFVASVLLAATFFGICRDDLFFASPRPLVVYAVVATGGLVALGLAPLLLLGRLLPAAFRTKLEAVVTASPPALLLAGFLLFLVETIRVLPSLGVTLGVWLAALAAASALLCWAPDRQELLARASALTRGLAAAGAVVLTAGLLWSHGTAWIRGGQEPERHVVLIIIDGMPSQFLARYNPQARPNDLDAVAVRGRTFTGARTNFTYTNGFFSALYYGHLAGSKQAGGRHLLAELEDAGVLGRWLVFHANGLPEAHRIRDYGGLRSTLLTEQFAWWPRLLGVNYHTFLRRHLSRKGLHPRLNAMYSLLHGAQAIDRQGFLERFLPDQVRAVQRRSRRSFLLVHEQVGTASVQAFEAGLVAKAYERFADLLADARRQEYRYEARLQQQVDDYAELVSGQVNAWGRQIGTLLDTLEAEGRLENTLVVVTSDHGQIFSRGRLWYGYHPDEQVVRVPLFLFGRGLSGTEERAVDSLDVVRTIEEFLGSPSPLAGDGRNLLADFDAKYVPTLTTHAEERDEQFLVVFEDGRKHVLDLEGTNAPTTGVTGGGYDFRQQREILPEEPAMRLLRQAERRYFGDSASR